MKLSATVIHRAGRLQLERQREVLPTTTNYTSKQARPATREQIEVSFAGKRRTKGVTLLVWKLDTQGNVVESSTGQCFAAGRAQESCPTVIGGNVSLLLQLLRYS